MKLQKQGYNECFLATVAMLVGENIEDVRWIAFELTGNNVWKGNKTSHYTKILDFFNLPKKMIHYNLPASSIKEPTGPSMKKLQGKGSILLVWQGRNDSHIVAFENGKIFEPNGYIFDTWEELINLWHRNDRRLKSYTITHVK